jgi:hypothetical protein
MLDPTSADTAAIRPHYSGKVLDADSLDTLARVRAELLRNGARLLIDWHGANRDGDRHKVTVRVLYIAADYAERRYPAGVPTVHVLDITKHITASGWMNAARGSDGFVAVFGGGGTSPMTGTAENVAHMLGIEHGSDILTAFGGR